MSYDIPDKEILDNIKTKMAAMSVESANEIALLLLFAEFAALSHPFSSFPQVNREKSEILEKKISAVINDLSKSERERLAPLIRGVQMIKYMNEE